MTTKIQASLMGLAVSAIVPAAAFSLYYPLGGARSYSGLSASFVVAYFFSVMAIGVVGGVLALILSRSNALHLWTILVSGAVGGAVVAFVLNVQANTKPMPGFAFIVATGIMASLVFWFFWRCAKP